MRNLKFLLSLLFGFKNNTGRYEFLMGAVMICAITGLFHQRITEIMQFDLIFNIYGMVTVAFLCVIIIWMGAAISLNRLADTGYNSWFFLCAFVPYVNWIFMLSLAFFPSKNQFDDVSSYSAVDKEQRPRNF